MKVGAAIYSMLKDDSAVSALVGTRIYPELAEEGAQTPYVVYSVVSNTPVDTKDSAPVDEAQLEVFSVADTYAAANDLADKVRAALSRQSKKVYGTVTVQSVKYTNEVTEVSAERNMYISVQDYTARLTPVIPNLLLEQYPGAHAAYSLRRVRGEYNGPAIRLRRTSDGETLDIGFDAQGNLDTAASDAFHDGTNLTCEIWYDQSGNGLHSIQSTPAAQPLLYNNAGIIISSGTPGLRFVRTGTDTLPFDNTGLDIGSLSAFVVGTFVDTADTEYLLAVSGSDNDKRFYVPVMFNGNFKYEYGDTAAVGAVAANTSKSLHTMIAGSTQGNVQAWRNDINLGSKALDSGIDDATGIASLAGVGYLNGFVYEIVVYGSDQSTNRVAIANNINAEHSIY